MLKNMTSHKLLGVALGYTVGTFYVVTHLATHQLRHRPSSAS